MASCCDPGAVEKVKPVHVLDEQLKFLMGPFESPITHVGDEQQQGHDMI